MSRPSSSCWTEGKRPERKGRNQTQKRSSWIGLFGNLDPHDKKKMGKGLGKSWGKERTMPAAVFYNGIGPRGNFLLPKKGNKKKNWG